MMNVHSDALHSFIADCGSQWFKLGHTGDDLPRSYAPSIIAEHNGTSVMTDQDNDVPQEDTKTLKTLELNSLRFRPSNANEYTVKRLWDFSKVKPQIPTDSTAAVPPMHRAFADRTDEHPSFDATVFVKLLSQSFARIGHRGENFIPLEWSLLLGVPDLNPLSVSEEMSEVLFEGIGLSNAYIARRSVLNLFARGKTSGASIQMGASGTTMTPVVDGYPLIGNRVWTPFGGDMMDEYIMEALKVSEGIVPSHENGLLIPSDPSSFDYWRTRFIYSGLKESLLVVSSSDPRSSKYKAPATSMAKASYYELPDGTSIECNDLSCIRVPEALFDPGIAKEMNVTSIPDITSIPSMPDLFKRAVMTTEPDSRKAILSSVSFHGAMTKIPGLTERFAKALMYDPMLNRIAKPKVHAPQGGHHEEQFSSFLGGSILGNIEAFKQMWMSRAEYEEYGNRIVGMRCI